MKPVGLDDAGLRLQAGNDLKVIVIQNVMAALARGGHDHCVQQIGTQHMTLHDGGAINDGGNTLVAHLGNALVVHRSCHDRLAGQLLQPKLIEFMHRRDNHGGLLHGLAQNKARPLLNRT